MALTVTTAVSFDVRASRLADRDIKERNLCGDAAHRDGSVVRGLGACVIPV